MISVLNRLPLLSGSKIVLLSACFFLLSSCQLLQGTASAKADDNISDNKTEEKKETTQKEEHKKPPKKNTVTVNFHGEDFEVLPFENKFNVALILPFNLNKRKEDAISKIMLDYYEGVLIATDKLKEMGINLTLFVYDNLNDTNELKTILGRQEMETMSLIIGPVFKAHMEMVSKFSLKHEIPVLNPLSPHSMLATPNGLYFNNELEYSKIGGMLAEYMRDSFPDADILVVKDGKNLQKQILPVFADSIKKFYGKEPKYTTVTRGANLSEIINQNKKTVLFIPSLETLTVSDALNGLTDIDSNVIVFGFKEWLDLKTNDYRIWERCNVHLISSGFINYQDSSVMEFRSEYRKRYKGEPNEYVFRGYDDMLFFGEALLTFGPNFVKFIPNREFRYLYNTYKFVVGDKCLENNGIAIIKFRDYRLQRD